MLDNQLSPAGAFICSAVKAGAGVMVVLAGAADETPAPASTTSAKHENKKTSETRRMQLPPEIATGSIKDCGRLFNKTCGVPWTPPLRLDCFIDMKRYTRPVRRAILFVAALSL